jgi:hypothetical protein
MGWVVSTLLLPFHWQESGPVPILQEAGWASGPPWLRFFRAFSSVVRQMPGYNSPSPHSSKFLCFSQNFCVVLKIFMLFYVLFVLCRSVLFVCKCVLYNCHRVATQLQLTNISYQDISMHILYWTLYDMPVYVTEPMCFLVVIFKENYFQSSPFCRLRGERSTFTSSASLRVRGNRYPLNGRLGRPQRWSG